MPVYGKAYGEKPPTAFPKTLEIESTDFHIPSAPTTAAHLTENQNPDRRMIAPPAQMISSSSIPAAFQKIRFLMIDNRSRDGELIRPILPQYGTIQHPQRLRLCGFVLTGYPDRTRKSA